MKILEKIKLHDRYFKPYISVSEIATIVNKIAADINKDYKDKTPLIIPILNGAFIFAADLLRAMNIPTELSFIKMQSYTGTKSSGVVNELIGLSGSLEGKDVILVEDIVDTGNTLVKLYELILAKNPASISVATLLIKEDVYDKDIPINYKGKSIPNDFVVGYGMDYDELGRDLDALYVEVAD